MSTAPAPDVIVIGAGLVGTATALALAEAGARVTLVEGAFAGSGSTGAAMGHLVVMDRAGASIGDHQMTTAWHDWKPGHQRGTLDAGGHHDGAGMQHLTSGERHAAGGDGLHPRGREHDGTERHSQAEQFARDGGWIADRVVANEQGAG